MKKPAIVAQFAIKNHTICRLVVQDLSRIQMATHHAYQEELGLAHDIQGPRHGREELFTACCQEDERTLLCWALRACTYICLCRPGLGCQYARVHMWPCRCVWAAACIASASSGRTTRQALPRSSARGPRRLRMR